jgi:hypothetical protein
MSRLDRTRKSLLGFSSVLISVFGLLASMSNRNELTFGQVVRI